MSNTCIVPLFKPRKNSLEFINDVVNNSTIDNVVENVASFLKKEASFATTIIVAEDREKFEDNIIDKLIPDLIYTIQSLWKKSLSPKNISKLQKEFEAEFLPKADNINEEEIPETKTQSSAKNESKSKLSLRQLRSAIFKGSNLLSEFQIKQFSREIKDVIIYNSRKDQRTLVYDQKTLNENLKQYKQNLYEIIYDFCKENEIECPVRRSYYNSDNSVSSRAEEVMEAFYQYLMQLDSNKRLELLEKSWENITLNIKEKNSLLKAVNAYITLTKFDTLVKDIVGNYININHKLDEPINSIEHNGKIDIKYKYNFGRKSNLQKSMFKDEMQNALDTMGNFSKFLIESIPKIDSAENLNQIQFINALLHLKQAINNLSSIETNVKKYKVFLESLHDNPKESWKSILDNFVNEDNYDKFLQAGLTLEDINIIQSIQKFLYGKYAEDKKNSLYALEQYVHNIVGYNELYSLVDTILGTIDSISEINYLETYWDYESQMPSVRVKRKYFNNKQKLDLISGINQEASEPLSETQKNKYKISYLGGPFNFIIGKNHFVIKPTKKTNEFGIFSDDIEVTINGESLEKYFKNINLNGIKNRNEILKSTEGLNKEFLDLLKFIDGVLTTGFTVNNESLQKFYIYYTQSKEGLSDLVLAASRVYFVKDIERKFHDSIKNKELNPSTEKTYNEKDLYDWIKYHRNLVPVPQFAKEKNSLNKRFFGTLLGIPYLRPVQYKDSWVDKLGDAQAILMGESLKAVTKNFERKSIPNYSPAFLGGNIHEIVAKASKHPVTKNLIFCTKQNAIKQVIIDTDVKTQNGTHKQIKDCTEAELQYHFFVNKFLIPFMIGEKDEKPYRSFYSQPTVYSDKTKFIGYEIILKDLGIENLEDNDTIIELIENSLGKYFNEAYQNVLNDYAKLFDIAPDEKLIQEKLRNLTLEQLLNEVVEYNKIHAEPIELIQDLHYRNIKGHLGLNEILVYRSKYVLKNLPQTLRKETFNYVNTLLESGVIFDTESGFMSALEQAAASAKVNLNDWIDSNGMLILAKKVTPEGNINIVAGESLESDKDLIINPLIEKYVLLHNLINNNLKELLIGTNAIHKIKPNFASLNFKEKQILGFEMMDTVDLVDAFLACEEKINNLPTLNQDATEQERLKFEETISPYLELQQKILFNIRKLESDADNAQLKRTVAVPGTMRYFLQGTLTGILPTLRAAIIQDVHASVYNFEGDTKDDLEAHDGGSWLCPITAIYQNNSLQDSEVGDVIKPLWQADIPAFGGKRLVKYAANVITNAMMRNSEFSEISMYHMFKKMAHVRWGGEYQYNEKNLFNQYYHRVKNHNVSFSDIIQQTGTLYYTVGNNTYQIEGMGFENGAYYTEEKQVSILPNNTLATLKDTEVTYFHYFDDGGNHYKIKEGEEVPEGLHTIDSIYELHQVLGGIYSESFQNGKFIPSENSLIATANLINMVSERTQKCEEALKTTSEENIPHTQTYYYQPLKYKMVDYLINQSSIKNGSGNINFNTIYENPNNPLNDIRDSSPLRYVEMDTLRYGIQQDTEHDADNEELTEMSQVISAIDAGGYYHKEVSELYQAIGYLALKASQVELNKIKQFKKLTEQYKKLEDGKEKDSLRLRAQNQLYDLIGRVLIEHLSLNRGQNGIAESLIDRIKENFGSSTDHTLDEIKIAFSDQTIYSQIISTVASILNKKSVKRKFPGTGQVMAPGYNVVQLWNIDGNYSKFEDLVKEANQQGYTSKYIDPVRYNRDIVKQYLTDTQNKYAKSHTKKILISSEGNYSPEFWENQLWAINPIDVIQCTVDGKVLKSFKLDKIKDYYLFKSNPIQYLLDLGLINEPPKETLEVVKRIDIPGNLAPLNYNFTYIDDLNIKHTKNVYDIWAVKAMYFDLEVFKSKLSPDLSEYEKEKLIEQERLRLRTIEQSVLSNLENGIFIAEDGKEYKIVSTESTEAQAVMSNIFKSKFEIEDGESLHDILKQGPARFIKNPLKKLPNRGVYDLALLKSNGKGLLISFNDEDVQTIKGFYKVKYKEFKNINEHEIVLKEDGKYYDYYTNKEVIGKTLEGNDIYSYIYSLDSNNSEITPIGIKIDVSNKIEYDGKNFIYKDSKQKISEDVDLSIKDGKVLETIYFVNKKVVSPKHQDKYTVYTIKEKLIKQLFGENYITEIITALYKQDNYTYILPNRFVNTNNLSSIKNSIKAIEKICEDPDIKNYIYKLKSELNHLKEDEDTGIGVIRGFNGIFKDFNLKLATKVFNSFKESLYFISSRIPAQSLQSFMKMRVVGFINSGSNIAYVSHWQTWLQGSDYDIDKSYMLGNEFDDNGLYQKWSPLFDYSYLEESKKLPFPTGIEVKLTKDIRDAISIEEFVKRYKNLKEEKDERGKLLLYNELIRYINSIGLSDKENLIKIAQFEDDDMDIRRHLVQKINSHNTYEKGLNNIEASLKNFISNKLQTIIQGTSNFIGSHAPITMGYLHDAVRSSSRKNQIWTVMNPGYIPLMQTQAMVGKKGVGIAANGQKASFIWKYWMTDCINNNNPYKRFINFPENFSIGRIEGRFGEKFGNPITDRKIKRLPDINMNNTSEEDKLFYEYNENHYIPSDQMSSQMISAATDNAKELILDKINANTDLSKIYMYLITLGFDVKDIVSFMTSPAIDLIARNATQNIFLGTSFKTKDVANYILNKLNSILSSGEDYQLASTYSIDSRYSFVLDNKIEALLSKILRESNEDQEVYTKKLLNIREDIQEFLKVYELSEEFSYAGRVLGLNGGIPTTKEKLINFKKFLGNLISSRELAVGIKYTKKGSFKIDDEVVQSLIPEHLRDLIDNFDSDKYLDDKEYRIRVMEYYELIKGSLNVPAMIEGTEQFQTILEIANVLNIIDKDGITKSKAANTIYERILKIYPYADSKYAMQILPILNQVFIQEFIENTPIQIPVQKDWKYISKKWEEIPFANNTDFTIGISSFEDLPTEIALSSFHYIMDKYIIPSLKNGELIPELKNNAFIQNLIPIVDGSEVRYKINIDMRAAQSNPESKVVLNGIIKGLQELQNYNFGNRSLLDIFMLYSLVVDQNRQGSDRLTDLFASFVTGKQNNLLTDYYKFIGEIEINNESFIEKINNISTNAFLVSLANQVASERGHNEPSIKVVTDDGTIDYRYNQGYGKYKSFGDFLPRVTKLEDPNERLLRLATREKYKFGLIYDGFIQDTIQNMRNFEDSKVWISNFIELMASGYIDLKTECY